jgi:GNAT superfamily N-acetyltransferase
VKIVNEGQHQDENQEAKSNHPPFVSSAVIVEHCGSRFTGYAKSWFYTGLMFETRLATVEDAELIARQRRNMFVDAGQAEDAKLQPMMENFVRWVRPKLEDGSYVGWLTSEGGRVVAGAGMWLMDFPPHWMDAEPVRAYLLNFYVDADFRGHGLAFELLKTSVEDARRRGYAWCRCMLQSLASPSMSGTDLRHLRR